MSPTHKRTEGLAPVWGSEFTTKAATLQMVSAEILPSFRVCGPSPSWYPRPRLVHKVLDRGAQAVVRGGVRCASQVLDRGAQADARGATHVLGRGEQAVARGTARCALHVHGRGAKTYACGRNFAVLSTQF